MPLKDWSTTDADNDDADLSNNIRWTEGQAPSTVNNSARGMMTQIKRWWNETDGGTISNATVGGTADVITLTTDQGVGAYAANQRYVFTAGGTNTTNVTVNVDALGAKAVNSHGDPLAAGAIVSGDEVMIIHDGTDFELVYPRRHISVDFTIVNDGAGAANPGKLVLWNDSASPATFDNVGRIDFVGKDSAGNQQNYALILGSILDATSTSEDGQIAIQTIQAGSASTVVSFGPGISTPNATSGDQGADTINASDYYDDGTEISTIYYSRTADFTSAEQTVATDTLLQVAHSLGAVPSKVEVVLRCKTGNAGYSANDEIIFNNGSSSVDDQGVTIMRNATNVEIAQGNAIPVINKSTFNKTNITVGSWKWVIRAWT